MRNNAEELVHLPLVSTLRLACCWQDLYRPYEESFAESSEGGVAEDTLVVNSVLSNGDHSR